jgi:GNAT superfamily N-acetyltransferase
MPMFVEDTKRRIQGYIEHSTEPDEHGVHMKHIYEKPKPGMTRGQMSVRAFKGFHQVGYANFDHDPKTQTLHPLDVHVNQDHRRQGIATKMYDHAKSRTKSTTVAPGRYQQPDGQAFRKKYNNMDEEGRCWKGFKPVPGKKPYSKGSCEKPIDEAENKAGFSKDLTVYHGTGHHFDHFSDDHSQKNRHSQTPEREVKGHFFTSDPNSAYSYASRSAKKTGNKPRVIAAHLHMENPYNASKDIKKHMKNGATFSDAKNKAYTSVDRTKHDGVYHNGNGANPSEYVAFHAHHVKPIR